MAKPLIVSPSICQGKAWFPPADMSFAQSMPLVPIHSGELAKAAASGPLAFVKRNGCWQMVAVCSLMPGYNLFVKEGKWLGVHAPDWLSTYPFYTLEAGKSRVLAFDQSSDLLAREEQGEPFFDDDGAPSSEVASRIEHIKASQGFEASSQRAIEALLKAEVIMPWPESLKEQIGIELDGLHMLNERALNALDDSAFAALRRALPLAYAVNFSVQQSHILHRLARLHPDVGNDGDMDMEQFFDEQDDTLHFDF